MCLRADLMLTNAGQDEVLGTPKILRGNINHEKVYAISVYRKIWSRKWESWMLVFLKGLLVGFLFGFF